jgi:RNA polymerase sigma factor (sigma-70 family)
LTLPYNEHWEDLRQTVLLKLIETFKKGQLRDMKAFVAYVRTTTRRAFFDLFGEREMELVDVTEQVFDRHIDDASALHAAINRLPDKLKKVVEAVFIMDLTYTTAAQSTGIPLGTLKRYLQQAITQLRTLMNHPHACETTSMRVADGPVSTADTRHDHSCARSFTLLSLT